MLFSRDDVNEDEVYQFTKVFWDNLDEVRKDPNFKIMKKEYAVVKTEVPLHPGAQRYFKEAGLLK